MFRTLWRYGVIKTSGATAYDDLAVLVNGSQVTTQSELDSTQSRLMYNGVEVQKVNVPQEYADSLLPTAGLVVQFSDGIGIKVWRFAWKNVSARLAIL